MRRFAGVRALVAASLLATCFTIPAAGAGAAPSAGTRLVAPRPLLPHGAKPLGPVSPSARVAGEVVLQPRDESALTRFISQVTDKHSPLFHRYLTPEQFAARFGPAPASIAAVKAQLEASGLTVTSVARDGLVVSFAAPASDVEAAFRTGLERYQLASGEIARARTAPVRVPATIAKYVTSVVGLDTTVRLRSSGPIRAPRSMIGTHPAATAATFSHPAGSPTPCAGASAAAQAFGGLTDDQIANAYGVFGLYGQNDTGSGQHIAVFELEPFATSDLQTFDQCYFGATAAAAMLARLQVHNVDGGPGQGAGSGEAILDLQDVSAFAPGAHIDVYQAPNSTVGSFDEYLQIVNDDVDQVVTTSWGLCEQAVQEGSPGIQQAENLIFQEAAAQGQTVFSAAGDEGSNDCNAFRTTSPVSPALSVGDPSSQPYVVAVGGTTIDNATQPALEHVWNDGAAWGAGGGGISESWPMPTWQLDALVPGVHDPAVVSQASAFEAADLGDPGFAFCASDNPAGPLEAGCRELPDVSAQADEFTGAVTIYAAQFGGWLTTGGTSSAAPMWAGMLADVNASNTCKSNPATASGVGFVNPLLYSVASNPTAYRASFNDITQGNNDQYGVADPALYSATTGYDMASGLGSPQLTQPNGGAGLAYYLCSQAPAATRPTVTGLSPAIASTSASGATVTITGTNFFANGAPDVKDVQVGTYQIPPSDITNVTAITITAVFPAAADVIPPNDQTDGAGRVQVTVTLLDGETSAVTGNSWFTYVDENGTSQPRPTVTDVHSSAGLDAGGNTVDILGAGFTGATDVTFGGVSVGAGNFTVLHDWEIQATVPPFQNGTTTCDQDGSSFDPSENATNDICQAQVVVTTPAGSSTTSTILPLYEGGVSFAADGVLPVPPGTEAAPAATEYDYVPAPTITSISTTASDPGSLASEDGGSVVTLTGKGFNLAALQWVNFGDPAQASSQQFLNLVSVTGTEIEIQAPALPAHTVDQTSVSVSVQSVGGPAGLSNQVSAVYAGVPTVSSVLATSGPTAGEPAGPDTGGTPIDVKGAGFANQVLAVTFDDIATQFSFGTQYVFSANSDGDLTTKTVSQNPAVVDTQLCTVTDCSAPSSAANDTSDLFLLYPPGNPKIDSISPATGPATGGTEVTITGENLGCVTDISFGNTAAETFSNAQALLDCGSTSTVTVTAPPHPVGPVTVTLETVESVVTGAPPATASFTYTTPPAELLTVHRSGTGSGKVTSNPPGIRCGPTCSHGFPQGTSVTLTAKAARGSTFVRWSGACTGRRRTCKLTVDGPTSLQARFTARKCVVPKLEGKTLGAAKRALEAHFCAVGRIRHAFSGKVGKGRVIAQKPRPHTHLRHGGKVRLTLSKGKKR
ncbi:MAG TPA: protease pro-enzyme activation domain-containing protein [Gaiellaceae bacterium]|nr:protease pro-enzyme activation domain-containing protein [Gaiellaceae bacterium]